MISIGVILDADERGVTANCLGIVSAAVREKETRVLAVALDGRAADHQADCRAAGADGVIDLGVAGTTGVPGPGPAARALSAAVRHFRLEVLAGLSSPESRDLLARTASLLGAPLVMDCETAAFAAGIAGTLCLGGNARAQIRLTGPMRLFGLLPQGGPKAEIPGRGELARFVAPVSATGRMTLTGVAATPSNTPDLATARIVIAGGRGVGSRDGFDLIAACARRLGAAVGASRAAVDAGFAPYRHQIGLTGRKISPRLYIACGVSGAFQHLAGVRSAGTILAINRDAAAPIFRNCDFGLVGDLFETLPALVAALEKHGMSDR
jgi:electron transfer flavoprotein alpha subunit